MTQALIHLHIRAAGGSATAKNIKKRVTFHLILKVFVDVCPGADSILTYEKKEGGSNRVFVFTTNNEKLVVAKLPFSNVGPRQLATQSEVATISYCEQYSFYF